LAPKIDWSLQLATGPAVNFYYLRFAQTQAQQTIINALVYAGIAAFAAISLALAIRPILLRQQFSGG
jgi:hypothetical protein